MSNDADEGALIESLLAKDAVTMSAWEPVDRYSVRQWCQVFGIDNERYLDHAPASMLHSWTMPGFAGKYPEGDVIDPLRAAANALAGLGYIGTMAVRLQQEYDRAVQYGDRLYRTAHIESISPRKATSVGDGYFVTETSDVYSDHDRVGTTKLSLFVFRPHSKTELDQDSVDPIPAHDKEPIVKLSLATRFIVAAAAATRDFEDVHIDPESARAKGGANVYMNIMTTLGLVQKSAEEKFGNGIDIKMIDAHLLAPAYPGEQMQILVQQQTPKRASVDVFLRDRQHAKASLTLDNTTQV